MQRCIIYLLKNTIDDKVYVGQTWSSLEDRWNNGHGYEGSPYIKHAIDKHGKENFQYEILGLASSQVLADYLECFYIGLYNSLDRDKGYNLKEGGASGKHSPETKQMLSEMRRGTRLGEENTFYGKHHTPETKQKVSKAKRIFSEEIEIEILEEYVCGGISMQQLASKYNVSVKPIFNIIKKDKGNVQLHQGRGYQRDPGSGRFCRSKS